ncbi:MAG: hypothetical protein RIQ94_1269 [Pseudomonadota bacterium]|jgi:hypothetical protein
MKSRANKNGGSRATYQWLVMVLSNGERSIECAMQRDKMGYIGCAEVRTRSFEKYNANDTPPIVGTSFSTIYFSVLRFHPPHHQPTSQHKKRS